MGFYRTNIANGELKKHIGAYLLCIGIGAGFVYLDGCNEVKGAYDNHVKQRVEDVIKPYKTKRPGDVNDWIERQSKPQ